MKQFFTVLLAVSVLAVTGCSGAPEAEDANITDEAADDASLTILAAASLQKSFEEIAEAFTEEHPNIDLNFNYAGSSTLVQNLESGAPADIFASADEANMDQADEAGAIAADTRELFASNSLVGIVPSDNPADVTTLEEANAEDVKLVVCAPQVPCGALAQTVAEDAGVTLDPVSEEQQVTDVLGKVRSGQADAGLVYATDAALAPDEVNTFEIDGAEEQLNHYPIARTANAEHPEAADVFLDYVRSDAGQAILEDNGFGTP